VGISKKHPAHGMHYDGISAKRAARNQRKFRTESSRIHSKYGDYDFKKMRKSTSHGEPKGKTGEAINNIYVHGGLTFSGGCFGCEEKGWHLPQYRICDW